MRCRLFLGGAFSHCTIFTLPIFHPLCGSRLSCTQTSLNTFRAKQKSQSNVRALWNTWKLFTCTRDARVNKRCYFFIPFTGIHTKEKYLGFIQTWDTIQLFFSIIFLGTVLSNKLLTVSLPEIKMSKYHFL